MLNIEKKENVSIAVGCLENSFMTSFRIMFVFQHPFLHCFNLRTGNSLAIQWESHKSCPSLD